MGQVVLPKPGGPDSRTWSNGSPRPRAASMATERFCTTLPCPVNSRNRPGRKARSACWSCPRANSSGWVMGSFHHQLTAGQEPDSVGQPDDQHGGQNANQNTCQGQTPPNASRITGPTHEGPIDEHFTNQFNQTPHVYHCEVMIRADLPRLRDSQAGVPSGEFKFIATPSCPTDTVPTPNRYQQADHGPRPPTSGLTRNLHAIEPTSSVSRL